MVARSVLRSTALRWSGPRSSSARSISSSPSSSIVASDPAPIAGPSHSSTPPKLYTQLLLHRRPYLTPPTAPFLEATYAYTARLTRALSAPLPEGIYFKKGSLAARRFAYEEAEAERRAFGFEPKTADGEVEPVERDSAVLEVLERADRADPAGIELGSALESAERKGERSVYLVVNTKEGKWRFPGEGIEVPADPVAEGEDDRGLAARAQANALAQLGPNVSLWPVGRFPIAHLPSSLPSSSSSEAEAPEAFTFIFKAHVLAGLPQLAKKGSVEAFAFLTKEELAERVLDEEGEEGARWWKTVEGLLNEY